MAKTQKKAPKKAPTPIRFNVMRVDASVGAAERIIERTFGLPKGSVHLILRNGRKARTDKKIGKFLKDWE
jgi:hypothetical protein